MYIVYGLERNVPKYERFGKIFKSQITDGAFKYDNTNYFPPNTKWTPESSPTFTRFMQSLPENDVAFTLETAYFGEKENAVSQENLVESGRCFARAIKKYIKDM